MKKLWDHIKEAGNKPKETVRRFPCSFVMLCLITAEGIYLILAEAEAMQLMSALAFGALICFLSELAYEYDRHRFKWLNIVVAGAATLVSYLVLKHYDNVYVYTALTGLGIAAVGMIAYILYRDRENRCLFSHLLKSAFIVWVFSMVILVSISVCIAAFHFLILQFKDVWKIYGILFITVGTLFSVTLFLSDIPEPKEEVSVPALYRTIIHKTLFYIYLVLIGILYLYIIKIIVTWKMPVGKLNWFGCFALVFYVFFYLSIDETDGRYQRLFKNHGAYLLMPVLAIQLFAIAIRLNAYGLTTARMMSLILIVMAVGFMVSQLSHIHVSRCFLFVALLGVLFTCTPLNIYDLPNRVQETRLKNALAKGGALVNEQLDDNVVMEAEYREDARSAYEYLRYSSGNKSAFFEEFQKSKIAGSLDDNDYYRQDRRSFYCYVEQRNKDLDISSYRQMKLIYGGDDDYDEELEAFFISLDEAKISEYQAEGLEYVLSDGSKIIFSYIAFEYDEVAEEFSYLDWEGILLSK